MPSAATEQPALGIYKGNENDTMSQRLEDTVVTYLRHLENSDWARARALCTDTATVWHNDGKGEQTIEENSAGMQDQTAGIESMHYDIVRQFVRPNEVLQQHVVSVVTSEGLLGRVHAAAYFRFEGGLISRIEEYTNSQIDMSSV